MRHISSAFVWVFLGVLGTGCTQSPEEAVLSAVKDYRLNNVRIEDVFLAEVDRLRKEGRNVRYEWTLVKQSETEYLFTTFIEAGAVGRKRPVSLSYEWLATKNTIKSKGLRSEVWNLKARNRLARQVIRDLSSPRKVARLQRRPGGG